MPTLRSFASLWTLTDHGSPAGPWSSDEKLRRIRAAGFDGVGAHPVPEIAEAAKRHGLAFIAYVVLDKENYEEVLTAAAALGPVRVNAFFGTHDTSPEAAASELPRVFKTAGRLGLELDLETHRDTCTETPEKIDALAKLYEQATGEPLRFCHDFSHPAVVKHLPPHGFAERLMPSAAALREVRQMHFRPFNGHHCQIPVTDGNGVDTASFADWLRFAKTVTGRWFDEVPENAELWWCPELGPVSSGYALECFPDVWEDTLRLKKRFEA